MHYRALQIRYNVEHFSDILIVKKARELIIESYYMLRIYTTSVRACSYNIH